jgi:polyisoprenoid-binding protein YceI
MKKTSALVVTLALVMASAGFAAEWTRSKKPAATVFDATGTGGFRFQGKTDEMQVTETDTTISVVVPLEKLDTGIAVRDKHTKKALETDKFKEAKLEVKRSALKVPKGPGEVIDAEAKGMFFLHGKQKEVTFKYKGSCNAQNMCDVEGGTVVNTEDFGIEIPSYMGITVKPNITVKTSFQLTRQVVAAVAAPAPAAPAPAAAAPAAAAPAPAAPAAPAPAGAAAPQ